MSDLECNSGLKYKLGDYVKVVKGEKIGYLGSVGCVVDINPELLYEYKILVNGKERCFKESELKGVSKDSIGDSVPCPTKPPKIKQYNPLEVQEGGGHYKTKGIQPVEYGLANNLSFPQVNIVKYVTRHEDKNGLEDLSKSIHYHFFEALRCYGVEGSTELKKRVLKMLGVKDDQ